MIDSQAYILAHSITNPALALERFRLGALCDPELDKLLVDMRECQKAWTVFMALVHRAKP